ncbi:MAG: macro domain-containing protein [Acidobacteria bacterium]|nr:macro domain-containing protein [Acidobacteriota bacterium]
MADLFLDGRVIVKVGDLTEEPVDAIVNAANSTLYGGGGVDGAIHSKGGPEILAACKKIRESEYPDGLPTGSAVITTGGLLPADSVIHTVGPIYGQHGGEESELLAQTYISCLDLAASRSLKTIAFPSISTGAFGYPKPEAAEVSSIAIKQFVSKSKFSLEIRLVFFSVEQAATFLRHQAF